MSNERTVDLYLIQSPETVQDDDNIRGFNRDLLRFYDKSISVQDVQHFIAIILGRFVATRRKIKKLAIGSHGMGLPTGLGYFQIGKTKFSIKREKSQFGPEYDGDDYSRNFEYLRGLGAFFSQDADVYILACKAGFDDVLMRATSTALGGVRVHGYTEYITTTNYGLWTSVDDGTDDEGSEIVCWPSVCLNWTALERNGRVLIYRDKGKH